MTEGDALYRAILEAPDDDAPRLVWADWLEENGDPDRAEFVRLQCEWANLVRGDPRYMELLDAWKTLAGLHGIRWVADLGQIGRRCGFWRGLPDHFVIEAGQAIEPLDQIRRHVPAQCVALKLSNSIQAFQHWTGLDTIRHLELLEDGPDPFYPQSSVRGWVWLIQSPQLKGLRGFVVELDSTSVGTISAIAATEWPNLRDLTLNVRGAHLAPPSAAWADLPDAPWFPNLRSLDLYGCFLGDDMIAKLLLSRATLALTHLELGANDVSPALVRRLLRSPKLPSLRLFELGGTQAEAFLAARASTNSPGWR